MRKEWFLIENYLLNDRNEKSVNVFCDILREKEALWPFFNNRVQMFQRW